MRHHGDLTTDRPNPEVTQDVARVGNEALPIGDAHSINDAQSPVTFDTNMSRHWSNKLRVANGCTKNALVVFSIIHVTTVIPMFVSSCVACPVHWVELNDSLQIIFMYLMGCTNIPRRQVGPVEEGSDNGQYDKMYNS